MDLDVSTREEAGRVVVVAIGEVDVYTAPQLDAELSRLTADGRTDLVVTSDRVAKVFRITGLDQLIPLHASLADALA